MSLYHFETGQLPFKLDAVPQSISDQTFLNNIATAIESNSVETADIPEPYNEVIQGLLDKNVTTRWSAKKHWNF